MSIAERYAETVPLPRAIRFPVELIPPEDFDPARIETWPAIGGRLEYVGGRLLYMPPCGELQQEVVADLTAVLAAWVRQHRDFAVGTNEAGMLLHGEVRGADAGIWRREGTPPSNQYRRAAPVLAVEVAGEDEDEEVLRRKAEWYLDKGVEVVWIVLPEAREVVVVTQSGQQRCGAGEKLPAHPALPGLTPSVDDLFLQISGV